jgi:hypothetical protein
MEMQLRQQGYMDSQTGELFPVWVARTAHGDWIHDPYVHQDGRASATPSDQGLTNEEANELVRRNEECGFRWKCEW